jgi:hypothetical protein
VLGVFGIFDEEKNELGGRDSLAFDRVRVWLVDRVRCVARELT